MGSRVSTGPELKKALDDLGKELVVDLDKVLGKLSLDGYREVIRRTPVRTGFLKSRWALTTGQVPNSTIKNPGGSYSEQQPNVKIKWGDVVGLYNNAEYAEFIENGTPEMRAQPMIQPTFQYLLGLSTRLLDALSRERKT